MLTLADAEEIRRKLDLKPTAFSVRISYSQTAYPYALLRGKLSQRMAREIHRRYGTLLKERR